MLFKETFLHALDNSGANIVKLIQSYPSSTFYKTFLGKKLKVTLVKRRKKLKRVLVKRVFYLAVCVHQKKEVKRLNGHYIKMAKNQVVLFSLNNSLLGTRLYGPLPQELVYRAGLSASVILMGKRFF